MPCLICKAECPRPICNECLTRLVCCAGGCHGLEWTSQGCIHVRCPECGVEIRPAVFGHRKGNDQ